MANGEIKVGYTELSGIAKTIKEYTEKIDELKKACENAGKDAVAAGGQNTRIATEIGRAVVDPSATEFEAVKQIIEGFADALTKVSTLYSDYDQSMYDQIKKIADDRQTLLTKQAETAQPQAAAQ